MKEIITFIFIHIFILDSVIFATLSVFGYLVGYFSTLNEQSQIKANIIFTIAGIFYILKLFYLPLQVLYLQKRGKKSYLYEYFLKLKNSKKLKILVICLTYFIMFMYIFFNMKFNLYETIIFSFILSSSSSYVVLFIYWDIMKKLQNC